jgi:hypothetical protein
MDTANFSLSHTHTTQENKQEKIIYIHKTDSAL